MTDGRDDDRHLKSVDESDASPSAPSEGSSSSSGSPSSPDESIDSSGDSGRRSSSEAPPTTPNGDPAGASRESVGSESSEVDSDDSERLRSVGEESPDAEASGDRDAVTRERDELRETLQRVQADFENFRKRTMRDQSAQLERATDGLIEQLLPVLDSFELAALNVPAGDLDDAAEKLRKGVELVYAELLGVLEKAGLERIDALGQPFDPEMHEAVMRDGDGEEVTEVMRTGYRLKGRVLRPAMVKVGASEDV